MDQPDRTIPKPSIPLKSIIGISVVALGVVGFIFFAIWYSGAEMQEAKATGTIIAKDFTPQAERQITIGEGGIRARDQDGEYTLTVEVRQRDGTMKRYTVYLDKERYDAVDIGDQYDVGPYIVP